jgi:ATP-dependent DNA helicase RecQ
MEDELLGRLDDAAKQLGHTSMKPFQREVVEAYLGGKDVFLMAPTGSGKSLTYEVAPLLCVGDSSDKKMVIVVSPLVALMQTQTEKLKEKGFSAIQLTDEDIPDDCMFLFASPESLLTSKRNLLLSERFQHSVCALFVDEGHCVVKW